MRNGSSGILNITSKQKIRYGQAELTTADFSVLTSGEHYFYSETSAIKISVRPMSIWWR